MLTTDFGATKLLPDGALNHSAECATEPLGLLSVSSSALFLNTKLSVVFKPNNKYSSGCKIQSCSLSASKFIAKSSKLFV